MKAFADDLRGARVHIGGMGRIGTTVALALHEAGVGEISGNDPQKFEEEQLQVCGFSRRSDLGRPKVHVLERYFAGRPNFVFTPVVGANQSPAVKPYIERADVIVSCANQLHARLCLERMGVRLGKPIIQACAQDARQARGGIISVWMPGTDCSCFGCLFSGRKQQSRRGEVLIPTVTRVLGSLAAGIVVGILGGTFQDRSNGQNVFAIDLLSHRMDPLAIRSRPGCTVCGHLRSLRA